MEKRVLQTYSTWAKENLENQIEVSLKALGINGDKEIRNARRVGDFTIIDGDANSYPAELLHKRSQIVTLVQEKGYKNVIEEFAYTWFNRFVALRFMEVHDFLPHGFRVLSNRNGGVEPEILKNLSLVQSELRLDPKACEPLKAQGKTEELYRYVLLRQCAALADILPMLFARENDYLELLLPKSLLIGDTVITRLRDIPEDAFLEDVEIIGWLYQFYISAKKDAVNKEKKTITKDTLPAVTQLFTPKWIVRYMAENSVGRIWLESYPASPLRIDMPYYVDEAEQTEDVQRQLEAIRYRNVDPKDLRVIDPCCGSGHILVYVFDLLWQMYDEKGYARREIPTLILKNNLVGLDVDKRAAQLASFALVMKARSANNRFFNGDYYAAPQVHELRDSHFLERIGYRQQMAELAIFTEEELRAVSKLVDTFRYGKTIGSLIKVPAIDFAAAERAIEKLENEVVATTFNTEFLENGTPLLKALLTQARAMSAKYDVMITNPPYLGTSAMEPAVKDYAAKNYPNSKADLFAMFMETGFVSRYGFTAMINMHSWMFLASYEKLRVSLLASKTIITMAHLGARAFDSIAGEVVQTTAFVTRNLDSDYYSGVFYRLVDYNSQADKEAAFLANEKKHSTSIYEARKIPGWPIVYWLNEKTFSAFDEEKVEQRYSPRNGITTGENDLFIRYWHEVGPNANKWHRLNKGGSFRKWYGNLFFVIDWENDGYRIRNLRDKDGKPRATLRSIEYNNQTAITMSRIVTGCTSFRFLPSGFITEGASNNIYIGNRWDLDRYYLLAFLNSKPCDYLLHIFNPTINIMPEDLRKLPLVLGGSNTLCGNLVKENICACTIDWNSFETSWDFTRHPLVQPVALISEAFDIWDGECKARFHQLKANEEELNRIFIDIYGLQDELTPEVKDEDVTVRLADKERDIKSLISYLVGLIMGRYSLDVEGLAYAGGDWDASRYRSYHPDDDGIVPIYAGLGMEDGLTARVIRLIKRIYGEDSYRQNIDFIAEALGKKSSESSEETLNRYLNEGFYADHLKIYQKRPIYWLFSSGKHSGFKCLIYMHRYNADTLARINGKYFLPESTRLKNELDELLLRISRAEGRDRVRLEKERQKLAAAYNEALEYGQVLDHMANKYISIDLDDGVKVNYAKFQGVELVTDSGTKVKKDLLSPIK